jgi:invasion protein IalB
LIFYKPLFLVLIVLLATPADAKFLDNHGSWSAFTSGKVCYIATEPKKTVGKYKKRGTAALVVTHGPGKKEIGMVSVQAGYTYKKGSSAIIAIGDAKIKMFTHADTAWAAKPKTDKVLVTAMKAGAELAVRGQSSKGTKTTDLYSLKGFTAAYKAIGKACKVKG